MPTKEKNTKEHNKDVGQLEVEFITSVRSIGQPGMIEHKGEHYNLTKKAEDVKNDFAIVMNQLTYIVTEADKGASSMEFQLDEITVSLGFSAKGKIAFIAEAGVEASIEVKFKRK